MAVPDSAVIDSGNGRSCFVDKGEGRFEPRDVKIGCAATAMAEITRGHLPRANGRRLGELPDRCRKQSEGGAAARLTHRRRRSHDRRASSRWSARNLVLVFVATAFAVARRHLCARARCRSTRFPISPTCRSSSSPSIPGQAPQVVEDQVTYPLTTAMLTRAEVEGGARLLVLRRLVRLRDLRGRHRHLLGAQPRARISERRREPPAGGRDAEPRARRHRRRLGLPVRACIGARTHARRAALDPGLVSCAIGLAKAEGVAEVASVGGFVKQYQRRRRSARGCRPTACRSTKSRDAVRASNIDVGGRTVEMAEIEFMVRGRGYLRASTTSRASSLKSERRHAGAAPRRRARRARCRTSGAASPS